MAIIHKIGRPAIIVHENSFTVPKGRWKDVLESNKDTIQSYIESVGRIESSNSAAPFLGTAFIVNKGIAITTKDIAMTFSEGHGSNVSLKPSREVWINFGGEIVNDGPEIAQVTGIAFLHPYLNIAALRVNSLRKPLKLECSPTEDKRNIVVIGYPAQDRRNEIDVQDDIFERIFDVKRLMPGRLGGQEEVDFFGHSVTTVTHDASTLGGTSGSPLIDIESGKVIAIHSGGSYLEKNYAVPAWILANDRNAHIHLGYEDYSWIDEYWGKGVPEIQFIPDIITVNNRAFSEDEITDICRILIKILKDTDMISLTQGIPNEITANIEFARNFRQKLKNTASKYNEYGLLGGVKTPIDKNHSPIYYFLANAIYLNEERLETIELKKYLEKVAIWESPLKEQIYGSSI